MSGYPLGASAGAKVGSLPLRSGARSAVVVNTGIDEREITILLYKRRLGAEAGACSIPGVLEGIVEGMRLVAG